MADGEGRSGTDAALASVGEGMDAGFGEAARRKGESGKRRLVVDAAGRRVGAELGTEMLPPPGRARPADSFCSV